MNMAEINVNHINPFLMAAGTILRDACQMEMSIGKPYVKTCLLYTSPSPRD